MFRFVSLNLGLMLLTLGCTKGEKKSVQLFYGACKITVNASPAGAEILLDGIHVSDTRAETQIPCGEKRVVVQKEGYVPYETYLTLNKDRPLDIAVELQHSVHLEKYALSDEFLNQVKAGEALIPKEASEVEIERLKKLAALRNEQEMKMFAKADAGAATKASSVQEQSWDSVEDWR